MSRIPKVIHYCWLSNDPYPELINKCIQSWKEKMPEYEFVLWDTNKFDINSCKYVKEAYEARKYAFASDYIRLYALYHYGGVYLDSDIQVFKNFEPLLDQKAFTGFENTDKIAAWILASEPHNPIFKEFLDYYENRSFVFPDGTYDLTPNVHPITATCLKHGLKLDNTLQMLDQITVYPRTYFCPMIPYAETDDCYSENTYAQHLFNAGWIDTEQKKLIQKKHHIEKRYGKYIGLVYYGIAVLRKDGFYSFKQQWVTRIHSKRNKKEN